MPGLPSILDKLEAFHGPQSANWPTDPYLFLVWWHCGYPQSEERCNKGWESLHRTIGTEPARLLKAGQKELSDALKAGGMVPEARAMRLRDLVERVEREFSGDLRSGLAGMPIPKIRAALKKFPNIAGPGADRILLFGGISPVAAVPSNCEFVTVRILKGQERNNYASNYKEAQSLIDAAIPPKFDPRQRAYLLLKRHGQTLCKRAKPKCDVCPVASQCAFFSGKTCGRAATS